MRQKYVDFIASQVEEDIEIQETCSIYDLGLNSIQFIKLITMIESEFKISVDILDLDIEKYKTVEDLVDLFLEIENKQLWED